MSTRLRRGDIMSIGVIGDAGTQEAFTLGVACLDQPRTDMILLTDERSTPGTLNL